MQVLNRFAMLIVDEVGTVSSAIQILGVSGLQIDPRVNVRGLKKCGVKLTGADNQVNFYQNDFSVFFFTQVL